MLNGQTFSSRTGKTSGLPKLNYENDETCWHWVISSPDVD